MAEATLSSAESALENQRIGPLQLRVAALCTLIQICDGYDINSIAWSVPSLTHVWGLKGSAFTVAFLWSSIGILVGALSGGPIGDRVGRKPLLVASITIFGLASLASAFADSLEFLTVTRFFTGLGIGGAFPAAATLTGDYAPHHRRALMIMASFTGAPLGGFVGGQIVGLLRRLDIAPGQSPAQVDLAQQNPVKMLFSEGYALQTILLWIIFFCSLMNLFLFAYWMPTVLTLIGMSPPQAVFAS